MPAITIREVPEATRNTLASRAARNGQSLQEYLRSTLIDFAKKPDVGDLMDAVVSRKEATRSTLDSAAILGHLADDRE